MESDLAAQYTNDFLIIVGFTLYFIPAVIAFFRVHPNRVPIIIINIFLGWTLIGWVVSLAWSCSRIDDGKCYK
jgi:hypothetical protein